MFCFITGITYSLGNISFFGKKTMMNDIFLRELQGHKINVPWEFPNYSLLLKVNYTKVLKKVLFKSLVLYEINN